ncbi:MAG: DUF1579 family protein [Planctomycetes bacterium]|nr:DUF1579 family protein [Planctomycetota bacterium]
MHKTTLSLACSALCALTTLARSQDEMGPPKPAPELKKLAPMIGSWSGGGVFNNPETGPDKWKATGTYRWTHDGFWVQEDFTIHFESLPVPMVFRSYLGWDGEKQRYVNVHAANDGHVGLDTMEIGADGAFVTLAMRDMQGTPFCERAVSKISGDAMELAIDFLMPEGPSALMVEGKFERVDAEAPDALQAGAFAAVDGKDEMARFGKSAGVYDIVGSMVPAPGAPPMAIRGTDTDRMIFGGAVMHAHTLGGSDGMPGEYVSDAFYGWNAKNRCYDVVFVSNMGEVGQMEARFSESGRQLVSTSAGTMMGLPMVQRFVVEVAENGAFTKGVGHSIVGTMAPAETFTCTYAKK